MLLSLALLACHPQKSQPSWRATEVTYEWPVEGADPIPLPDGLVGDAWLGDPTLWRWVGTPDDGRATSGSFGLGNATMFGIVGLDSPHDTITNLIGPGYQVHDGFFPDISLDVLRDGVRVVPTEERVERVRGVQIVRYGAWAEDLHWSTVDVLSGGVWQRYVSIEADADLAGVTVQWRAHSGEAFPLQRGDSRLDASCDDPTVGDLPAGEDWATICTLRLNDAVAGAFMPLLADAQAEATYLVDSAVMLDTPDDKVDDLYLTALMTLAAQTADTGAVSPMSRYTKAYLRDTEGVVRFYLAAGLHDRAADALQALYAYAAGSATIANSYDLDGPTSDAPADWSTADFMPGRNPAEAPSYLVILDEAYRRASGEHALTDTAFLQACVERQVFTDGLLPFSGDETFRYTMAPAVGAMPEEIGWSSRSSLLWVKAAEALGMDTTEAEARLVEVYAAGHSAPWLSPIAAYDTLTPTDAPSPETSLDPWWLGYDPATDAIACDDALDAVLAEVWHDDGTVWSPDSPFFTGLTPGYTLAAVRGRAEADAAFNALDVVATPSGHFEEVYTTADLLPLDAVHTPDGLGGDVSARFRPWETGAVVASMLEYLIGARPDAAAGTLTLDPHLPNDWPWLHAERLRMGIDHYTLDVHGYVEGIEVVVTREGGSTPWEVTIAGDTRTIPPAGTETWSLPAAE